MECIEVMWGEMGCGERRLGVPVVGRVSEAGAFR